MKVIDRNVKSNCDVLTQVIEALSNENNDGIQKNLNKIKKAIEIVNSLSPILGKKDDEKVH
jgi:flagellin-specific chaperone FliS